MRAGWWLVPLAVHGLIHLMGFAKAVGYAGLPQLTPPLRRETRTVAAAGLAAAASRPATAT